MRKNLIQSAMVIATTAGLCLSAAAIAGDTSCPGWDTSVGQPGAEGGSVSGVDRIGDEVFIGGAFTSLNGDTSINSWGRYNLLTGQFLPLGDSAPDDGFVTGFMTYDDGNGEQVYITGSFNSVTVDGVSQPNSRGMVRWDGTTVSTVPGSPFTGTFDFMWDAVEYNGLLVTGGNGGRFVDGVGIVQKPTFAYWDGSTWIKYSEEFTGQVAPVILCMAEYQGELYFGGRFTGIDVDLNDPNNPVVESNNILRWDGTDFSGVGGGLIRATSVVSQVMALKVFDDGSGEKLYAGGRFDRIGSASGPVVGAVARWDGTQWEVMPGFPQAGREVRSFAVYDNELYAVGTFESTGDGSVENRKFAKWNGTSWEEVGDGFVGAGFNLSPSSLTTTDTGLFIGGSFEAVGNDTAPGAGSASGIVEWTISCGAPCPGDVNGDQMVDLDDLNLVLTNFGQTTSNGDADGNGVVDLDDLNLVLTNFGTNC